LIKPCGATRLVCALGAFGAGALRWVRRASYHADVSFEPVFMEDTQMAVRRLRATDLEQASAVCMASFMEAVAPSLSPLGIETFTGIVSMNGFADRMSDDNDMFVFETAGRVVGVAELMGGQHVATLFVAPGWQGQGVGRALMAALLECARGEVVTVRASLSSVSAYERYGFRVSGEVGEYLGLVYQPMEMNNLR